MPPPAPEKVVDAKPDVATAKPRDQELAKLAAGYVDALSNSECVFTPDGKRVVFVSNRDGLPQLYVSEVNKASGPLTRLVQTDQRVATPIVTRDGKAVLFRSDTGADENWSIFRVGLDGKDLVELTTGDKLNRDVFFVPEGAKDTMFFSGRKISEPKSTVYSASTTTPGPAKAVYSDDSVAFMTGVDPNGKIALVVQYPTRVENYLLRVDVASGKADKIYPTQGKVTLFDAKFSADGKLIYIATDGGGDQNMLIALDAKTGKQVANYAATPATAQIDGIAVAKKGGLVALTIQAGTHAEIVLLDGKKLVPAKQSAKLPLGDGNATAFSDDGKRLGVQWSTPSSPVDVYALDAATGTSGPLRAEPRPSLSNMPKIEVQIVDIPAFDGGKIPTIVYVPGGEHDKPHPVIVSYHGGPSDASRIHWSRANAMFLTLGYVVVEPNVRGSGGFGRAFEAADNGNKRLDAFKDIETSARWAAAQPWADKDRMVVFGGSYGGYTALIALSHWPDIWRAGVDLFGIVNMKTFMATSYGPIRKVFVDEFGDPDKDAEFLAQISPITDANKIVDPTFVYAGANDPFVPRSESDQIVIALRKKGIPTEYMVADNEGHSLARNDNLIQFLARAGRFLETNLK